MLSFTTAWSTNDIHTQAAMRILDIIRGTTVDGPGFRTSIYFAGCDHRCPDCHNPQSWDFGGGREMSLEELMEIILEEDFDVTLTGGDPLYQHEDVRRLVDSVVDAGHTVWIYTGFKWEEIVACPELLDAVRKAEIVVDSPFIAELRDTDLLFRGSSNQRLVKVAESIASGSVILR